MSFDAWVVGFGLSGLIKDLKIIESNAAYLVFAAVILLDLIILYRFFTVQLPTADKTNALAAEGQARPAPALAEELRVAPVSGTSRS
jgi:hypothetical protein